MNDEIQKLNEWLENEAIKLENDPVLVQYKIGNPVFKNLWPNYFRSLKDIDQKSQFRISSIHQKGDLLIEYLQKHKDEFIIFSFTGSAEYTRKN